MTREQWLTEATRCLNTLFKAAGHELPRVRLSVGFPGGGSAHTRIGEDWSPEATSDNVPQIFISPIHKKDVETLGTLVHELVHACVGSKAGHGPLFKKLALTVGLTGKMRSTTSSPALIENLEQIITEIGACPTGTINLSTRKKQSTRLGKLMCASCGYTARVTRKWIDELGAPLCPCNSEPMEQSE